jgi:uncharacterized protein YbjT (DUF2867 family)
MRIAVAGATGRAGRHVVDVLQAGGHDAVAMSRSQGVDVITGEGLDEALTGADAVIDVATGPSPEEQPATEFFVTAARNLQEAGERAGVRRIVVASIVGADRFGAGYGAAKVAHEQANQAGPVPARILRATQFHEFVAQLVDWGTQGEVAYVPRMRTQLIAARTVAEALVDMATSADGPDAAEIAGPREESLVEVAELLVARRGDALRIEATSDPVESVRRVFEDGGLLPGPGATLAGPTFEDWLHSTS